MSRVDCAQVMRERIRVSGDDFMEGAYFIAEDYATLEAKGATHEKASKWAGNWRSRHTTRDARVLALAVMEVAKEVRFKNRT